MKLAMVANEEKFVMLTSTGEMISCDVNDEDMFYDVADFISNLSNDNILPEMIYCLDKTLTLSILTNLIGFDVHINTGNDTPDTVKIGDKNTFYCVGKKSPEIYKDLETRLESLFIESINNENSCN